MNNFMSLRVPPKQGNEGFARSCVAAFAAQLNPTVDQINDIKTAVSEAVTNSIIHGGLAENDLISIDVSLDGGAVHITVSDAGVGIEDVEKAKEPFFTTKPEDERTGMGFTIMDAFMDGMEVTSKAKAGVKISMTKIIQRD